MVREKSLKSEEEMLTGSFDRLTFRNIGYNSIARILSYIFALASNIVLGRCLLASDYGVVSFAFIFVNFMEKFADFGIGSAIVQRKVLDETTLYTAFTLKFILGCAVAGATFLFSFIVPYFFDNPDAVAVVRLLSLCFLFNNISFLPNTLLTREMNFKKISIIETTMYFLNSLVAIVLALNGYGYWSIVVAYLLSNFFAAMMLTLFRPVMIQFHFDSRIAKKLFGFGGYLFLSGIFAFLISNFDNLIIGSVKGAKELGFYAIAFNWGSMICMLMYSVVLRVIFPVMAKQQDEEQQIRNTYLKTLEYSGYLVIMVNIVLFVISREFLFCVLGHNSEKWMPALVPLRIICIYGIFRGLLEPVGQMIVAKGKPKTLLTANIFASVIEAAAIYPALTYYGIKGVAIVVTFAYLSQYLVYYSFLKKQMHIRVIDLAKAVRPSFYAALPLLVLYPVFSKYPADSILLLFGKAALMAVLYILILGKITSWEIFKLAGNLVSQHKKSA